MAGLGGTWVGSLAGALVGAAAGALRAILELDLVEFGLVPEAAVALELDGMITLGITLVTRLNLGLQFSDGKKSETFSWKSF